MQKNSDLQQYFDYNPDVSYHKLRSKLYRNWPWLLFFSIAGLGLGIIFSKVSLPDYEVNGSLAIKTDNSTIDLSDFLQTGYVKKNSYLSDHLGHLSSFQLNMKTISNLDWKVSWYEDRLLSKKDLYGNPPFYITFNQDSVFVKGVPIHIVPISTEKYHVTVDEDVTIDGIEKSINLDREGTFGEPFISNYFSFWLQPTSAASVREPKEYILIFNDLDRMALNYSKRLELAGKEDESNIINISLKGTNPRRNVAYMNELMNTYIDVKLKDKTQIADNTLRFVNSQISGVIDSLQVTNQNYTSFRASNNALDLNKETGNIMSRIEELESEETSSKIKLDYYQNLQSSLYDNSASEEIFAPSIVGITDPSFNAMIVKLSELYAERSNTKLSATESSPEMRYLEAEIQRLRKGIGQNVKNLVDNTEANLRSIREEKQQVRGQLRRIPQKEQELIGVKRQFDLNNDLYNFFLKKQAEAAIQKASTVADIEILDEASMTTASPTGPGSLIIIILATFLGLFFPVLFIYLKNYFSNVLSSQEEVESKTNLPIIGVIPKNRSTTPLPSISNPNAHVTESFRNLRTNLHFLTNNEKKVISIQSTMASEGKSFVAVNLAIALSLSHQKRTLLINADLRRGRIQEIIKVKNNIGLSNFLINKATLEEITNPTEIGDLHIIPSGPNPPNPAELLETHRFEQLVEECKKRYDYIIIDNSPVPVVTDGLIVGRLSEVNLFVVRMDRTNENQLKYINNIASSKTLDNVYIVLNSVKNNHFGYGKSAELYYNDNRGKRKKAV